ncbi:MAG: hypothetical protein M1537_04000 [Nitrospirae bacterium]|nr:hypothetical protein [Nitrospirota bacterium]MCL5285861.1 hypothetical protein [Nitrospirota bacterium]
MVRPPRPETTGWLLDAYPTTHGMHLWILTEKGDRLFFPVPFHPRFYIGTTGRVLEQTRRRLERLRFPVTLAETERLELFSGTLHPVLEVTVLSPSDFFEVVRQSSSLPEVALYNCDIPLPQLYFYESGLFPLAFCRIGTPPDGVELLDSPWNTDSPVPPIRTVSVALEEESGPARCGSLGGLVVEIDGERRLLDGEDPRELLTTLNTFLKREDPDLILTNRGDDMILPRLLALSGKLGIPLALNRFGNQEISQGKERSFFSYGKMVFRAGGVSLLGRWHLDRKNSFILGEAGLAGLFEQARVTRIPVQHLARTSTGTGITSMQMAYAISSGILVPKDKGMPEAFRSGLDLLEDDKGGMVFLPRPGFHESVVELDFASMYPSLMTTHNISPETVDCPCCPENRVPGSSHHLCTRRKGLVPAVLSPLLAKRQRYKELKKTSEDPHLRQEYEGRQGALKWLLVVSFGYLGYKNARFGKVEAHECVTALSRNKLLQAKEVAENQGYRFLHGIVDSLWLSRPDLDEAECRCLADEISRTTGLTIGIEGLYHWIIFFTSKGRPGLAVPNRYLGLFRSGEIKIRGIALRRSDTPPFIARIQKRMIDHLAQAKNLREYRSLLPGAREVLDEGMKEIGEGRIPVSELVIKKRISKEPEAYRKASFQAIVAQELTARGQAPRPGERISLVITGARDPDPASRARAYDTFSPDHSYDRQAYAHLLLQACEPLLDFSGQSLPEKKSAKGKPLDLLLRKRQRQPEPAESEKTMI